MNGVDWGSVPAWSSSLLTSGSLALGFYIVLRDRRKEEKAEARKLVFDLRPNGDQWIVTAHNASERPFTDLRMLTRSVGHGHRYRFTEGFLLPNGQDSLSWPQADRVGRAVLFEDADGVRWVKNLVTQELLRIPNSSVKARRAFDRVWQSLEA
ncbi:hypothetical protein [Kitasatospora indigofera]|uniref:hypothetical protein n=1 Tax=Kitasatospora indigofera TaxID=67307 RepID=UPI00368216B2